jgi:hypothetical protein
VIAATSPAQTWRGNLTAADRLMSDPDGYRMIRSHEQARPIARARRGSLALRGPKVSAFRDAIRGIGRRAVVDRWMVRALGLPESVTPRTYELAAGALERAAQLHSVDVHQLQATVWIAVRGAAD